MSSPEFVSPFLRRDLRAWDEVWHERLAKEEAKVNPYAAFAPDRPTPADRQATLAARKRRRLYLYLHLAKRELDRRELEGRPLDESERMAAVTLLTSIRRARWPDLEEVGVNEITDYERDILRHLNGEDIARLIWGAAMSEAVGALRGMGLVAIQAGRYEITEAGRALLTRATEEK